MNAFPDEQGRLEALIQDAEARWMSSVREKTAEYKKLLADLHHKNLSFGGRSSSALDLCGKYLVETVKLRVACYKEVQEKHKATEMLSSAAIQQFRRNVMTTVGHGIHSLRDHLERDKKASGDPGPLPSPSRYSGLRGSPLDCVNSELNVLETEGVLANLVLSNGFSASHMRDQSPLTRAIWTGDPELTPYDDAGVSGKENAPDHDLQSKRALISQREALLTEYCAATPGISNKRIYGARNSCIHKPQFYKWLKGDLPPNSKTTINFERFLKEKKPPIPRKHSRADLFFSHLYHGRGDLS